MGLGLSGQPRWDALIARYGTPVATYYCPSRRQAIAYPEIHGARYRTKDSTSLFCPTAGRGDYAANTGDGTVNERLGGGAPMTLEEVDNGTFTNWADPSIFTGICFERSEVTIGDVSDGTTNTYVVGEKYVNPDHYTDGYDGGDREAIYVGFANDNHRLAYPSATYAPLQDTPGFGSQVAFGSAHAAGFNAVFCDGSVHSISYQIEPTVHALLANRKDGLAIPEDAF
jgi:hypothetical protein